MEKILEKQPRYDLAETFTFSGKGGAWKGIKFAKPSRFEVRRRIWHRLTGLSDASIRRRKWCFSLLCSSINPWLYYYYYYLQFIKSHSIYFSHSNVNSVLFQSNKFYKAIKGLFLLLEFLVVRLYRILLGCFDGLMFADIQISLIQKH